jgi:hypothetical protein
MVDENILRLGLEVALPFAPPFCDFSHWGFKAGSLGSMSGKDRHLISIYKIELLRLILALCWTTLLLSHAKLNQLNPNWCKIWKEQQTKEEEEMLPSGKKIPGKLTGTKQSPIALKLTKFATEFLLRLKKKVKLFQDRWAKRWKTGIPLPEISRPMKRMQRLI